MTKEELRKKKLQEDYPNVPLEIYDIELSEEMAEAWTE